MPLSFKELLDAFEFVNFGDAGGENEGFLDLQTGKIYFRSPYLDDPEDAPPEDVDDEDKYVSIPDKRELGLGKPLVLNFASEIIPDDFEEVRRIFSRPGAYAALKELLHERGAIAKWHEFEERATEAALREWCDLHSIDLVD